MSAANLMEIVMKIEWQKSEYDAGYVAKIGNITLSAYPDQVKFDKAKRGTKWRAQVSRWDEATKTVYRYGRDGYNVLCSTVKEAMLFAEVIYNEERNNERDNDSAP